MHINKPQPLAHETMVFYETQNFPMFRHSCHGEGLEERQDLGPVLKIPAGQFTHNEGMTQDMAVVQEAFKDNVSKAKVFHPHRGVNE
jgi:hypothetical protein